MAGEISPGLTELGGDGDDGIVAGGEDGVKSRISACLELAGCVLDDGSSKRRHSEGEGGEDRDDGGEMHGD